jgi:hypothetical protein
MNSIKLNRVILFKFKDFFYNKAVDFLLIKYLKRNSWSYNIFFFKSCFISLKSVSSLAIIKAINNLILLLIVVTNYF